MGVRLEAPVRRVNSCLVKFRAKNLGSRHGKKVTQSHTFMSYFLRFRAVSSVPCSVKAHVGMEPHAKTQPAPVFCLQVTATQALELLASVSASFRHRICGGIPPALNQNA